MKKWMKKHKVQMAFVAALVLMSSCSSLHDRKPASISKAVLGKIYRDIRVANTGENRDAFQCKKSYDFLYNKIFNMTFADFDFDTMDLKSIDEEINQSFATRLALKESFHSFEIKNSHDEACLKSGQDIFRALRYIEDYLIEMRMEKNSPLGTSDYVSMQGEFPYLLINPKFADDFKSYPDLKSGDIILSRGNAYTSAAIARIATTDYQFSHLSFVYRDPASNELLTSEAHIEIGSVTAPFEDHLKEKNSRSVVLRYENIEVAKRASTAIFETIKKQQETGKNIEYDFSMNYRDSSRLFCAEVVSTGFKMIQPDRDYLPKFKSKFKKGMTPFLNTIGIPVTAKNSESLDTFAPGDIQFDPRFEIVAEWRNPKKMEDSRFKDFILTKMFELMESKGYQIDPNVKMDVEGKALWLLRRTPVVKKFLEKKFALNMNPAQLELFMAIDKIGDSFYRNLELRAGEFSHKMTPKEIYQAIDEFIEKDFMRYQQYTKESNGDNEKPLFHLLFHP